MSTSDSREESPSSSPTAMNHAPKFGTLIPNRVFVGGIAANTTKDELQAVFSKYGSVLATKIISDRAGISKGYGFVTFSSEAEAKKIQDEADEIYLNDRKLNIAPAIKKQPFNRSCDTNPVQPGPFYCQNGFPYTYQNGMAVFSHSADPNYSQCSHQGGGGGGATTVQMVYPQQYFVPHQYTQTTNVAPQQVVQSPQWTNWSAPPLANNFSTLLPGSEILVHSTAPQYLVQDRNY